MSRSVGLSAAPSAVLGAAKNLHFSVILSVAKDLHLLLLALLMLSAAPGIARAQRPEADKATEQALFRLENEFAQAVVKRDAATLVMKGSGPHGAFTNRYRYTDTFVKLDGRWQCVASQDYLMPEKKR